MLQRGNSPSWSVRFRRLFAILPLLLVAALAIPYDAGAAPGQQPGTYTNPLPIESDIGLVESCADPSVIEGQDGQDEYEWYMYCTTDPLNDEDLRDVQDPNTPGPDFNFHSIPQFGSDDLVNWVYLGDAFTDANRPEVAAPTAGLWAPEVDYINGQYYMFFGITDLADGFSPEPSCGGDNAIAYATSEDADGPWIYQGIVVEPRRAGEGCNFFWTFDPEVIQDQQGNWWIYYGSYYGGIEVRPLTIESDGDVALTNPATAVPLTIPNRYEGPEVVYKDGYYYLFVSATNCCAGERTGYSVFVGRSTSPTGPFVDREGNLLTDTQVGGTPFLTMNGNEWVGPGHNTVFVDEAGQWWTIYHAVNRFDPCFEGTDCFTKRPALLDPIDWINGWPTVNGGLWASDWRQPAPAAVEGQRSRYKTPKLRPDVAGQLIYSEEFNDSQGDWEWVEAPAATVEEGMLVFPVQAADLFGGSNNASVLLLPEVSGDYIVETKMRIDFPDEGCCHNFSQAGLVIYGDDDNYLRLTYVSIWETRQTEWGREYEAEYGNTVVGPPSEYDEWTYLRIVKRTVGDEDHFTAYTSQDGQTWVRGGVWTMPAGTATQVGLVSMGRVLPGPGAPGPDYEQHVAEFDYVRVYKLKPGNGFGRGKE